MEKIMEKIINNKNHYIIFYSEWCGYSINAIQLLKDKNVEFKGYIIEKICEMNKLIDIFNNNKEKLKFNEGHKTRPIIFYNGTFIGGYTELKNIL